MPTYHYSGPVPVRCAGRSWEPGEEAEVQSEINHPHFAKVKAKPPKEAPDADEHN